MTLAPTLRPWTVAEYRLAAARGVFGPDERLELIEGKIYRMSPQNPAHATACELVEVALRRLAPPGTLVRGQKPLSLGEHSEPEPDVVVVDGGPRTYTAGHPTSARLVVEVSDSSLEHDLGPKAELYARGGIGEYWVVSLPAREVVVHTQPAATGYGHVVPVGPTSQLTVFGTPLPVADLLP